MLNVQESLLKIKELKELIDRSEHGFPQINIYDKKADLIEAFMNSIIEEEEDMNDFNKWVESLIGRFGNDEPIIEIDLGNGISIHALTRSATMRTVLEQQAYDISIHALTRSATLWLVN